MEGRKKTEKGITLIALVVTIIVLIILATVSISMVTGENGLIKKAEQARDAYENSAEKEDASMNEMLKEMAKAEGVIGPHGLPTVNTLTTIQEENVKAEDRQGNLITVPRGFKVKTEYGTSVENGVVIEDNQGNQFVWVPCTKDEYKKHMYDNNGNGTVDDTSDSIEDTGNGKWKTYQYRNYTDWIDEGGDEDSVAENGGFYVARYEAGVPKGASFYVDKDTETKTYVQDKGTDQGKDVSDLAPVSKAGNQSWNYITQINARTVSANMYKENDDNYGVKSQLIDGVAWDVITEWMDEKIPGIANDSTKYGNYYNTPQRKVNGLNAIHTYNNKWTRAKEYSYGDVNIGGSPGNNRIEIATGLVSEFSIKNIYDMAGNMWEWTTETGYHDVPESTNPRTQYAVLRGGRFHYDGSSGPLSCRAGHVATTFSDFDYRVPRSTLCKVIKRHFHILL